MFLTQWLLLCRISNFMQSNILRYKLFFVLFLYFIFTSNNLFSQGIIQNSKVVATGRNNFDEFGAAVSIYGDYAVVGSKGSDTDPGDDNGAAFVYKRNSNNQWVLIKRLLPSDQQSYGYEAYGSSVDIYGDYIIVGSVYTSSYYGGVYVYKKDQGGTDNWGEIKKLEGLDASFNDFFGDTGISIEGDYIVVGATGEDEDASGGNTLAYAGSVYIFKKNQGGADNWGQIKKIVASDRDVTDFFGQSVDISGDYIVVGANYEAEDENGLNTLTESGSAYIFKKNQGGADNWGEIKKIVASDREASDHFGSSVSISGDYIIIGAKNEDEDEKGLNNMSNSGSAYLFAKDEGGADNWGQLKKMTAPSREMESYLGQSVSINGNYMAIGEPYSSYDENNDNAFNSSGAVYIYKKDQGGTANWGLLKKIVQSDRAANDYFGYSVAIQGDYIFASAQRNDYDENNLNYVDAAGAAYVFQFIPILSTTTAMRILDKFAMSGGNIESVGNLSISDKGIVWSTSPNPITNLNTKKSGGSGASAFNSEISGLSPKTLYYIRAYATSSNGGTGYGEEKSFTTKESIIIDGNQDGIDDTLQVHVETILNSNTNTYVTIESTSHDSLYNIGTISASENLYNYPLGLMSFKINASSAIVKLYFHGFTNLNNYTYRKLLPNGQYSNFSNAVFSTETLLEKETAVVTLTLTDGGPGDFDGIVNGVIDDPGGPAILATDANIPTLSDWARYMLLMLIFVVGFYLVSTKQYKNKSFCEINKIIL